ncbi:MAG: TetR/AcrR family transcriptional regulator, partial [Bacilli bacterium]|nr:TetR/AcrR family transcriptional regulator [Bacilli bacterium]
MRIQSEKYVDEYIISALFTLMKKKKYEDISITEITNKAGVSRVSFYRNFNSKEDIIKKWIEDITDHFLDTSN